MSICSVPFLEIWVSRELKLHNHFAFCFFENILADNVFSKQVNRSFTKGFFGPKSFGNFRREKGPGSVRIPNRTAVICMKASIFSYYLTEFTCHVAKQQCSK